VICHALAVVDGRQHRGELKMAEKIQEMTMDIASMLPRSWRVISIKNV
jgi:hypothetical protein